MAEKEHKKKHKPHAIFTRKAKDGSFSHEHHVEGEHQPIFAGTSQNMDDLKQHMEDHFSDGPAEEAAEQPGAGGEPEPAE